MIPYCRHEVRTEDRTAVSDVLSSDRLTQGPRVVSFEHALADRTGATQAVAVSSGTSALQIALAALGVGPGDEVLVPSLSFLATANAVLLAGATPIFVDVESDTLALDATDLERKTTPRTKGAVLVHYAGHVADRVACRARLGSERFLLEDACHALGARDAEEEIAASAEIACFSFHPAKHVTTGEGGAIVTRNEALAKRCRLLREHGMERDPSRHMGLGLPEALGREQSGAWVYEMQQLSGNHRLSDLAAALGTSQLAHLDANLESRRSIARRYDTLLEGVTGVHRLRERAGTRSAWHLYPIRLEPDRLRAGRAGVYRALHEAGIGAQVHYIPIHLQPYYRTRFGSKWGDLPRTEAAYLGLLSLPLFPGLDPGQVDRIVQHLARILREQAR